MTASFLVGAEDFGLVWASVAMVVKIRDARQVAAR
jgi:hypothetical protein